MPYFMSWDLRDGFTLNSAGIHLLKELMAPRLGVKDGESIATCEGLHVCGHAEHMARMRAANRNK